MIVCRTVTKNKSLVVDPFFSVFATYLSLILLLFILNTLTLQKINIVFVSRKKIDYIMTSRKRRHWLSCIANELCMKSKELCIFRKEYEQLKQNGEKLK